LFPHLREVKEAKSSFLIIKEQVNVGVLTSIVARIRPEQLQVLNTELLQRGFMLLEFGDDIYAFHAPIVAEFRP
jgi:hypothetical protein